LVTHSIDLSLFANSPAQISRYHRDMSGRLVLLSGCLGLAALACHGSSASPDAGKIKDAEASGGAQGGQGDASGPGGTTGSSSGGGSTSLDATEVCRAVILAQAERAVTCLGQDTLDYYMSFANACPDYVFNPDSNRKVEDVAACLPALRARTCTDMAAAVMPACYSHGKRAAKASCAFSSQCKSGGCLADGRQCGTCAEGEKDAGETCVSWASCAFGLHCTSGNVCAPNGTPTYAAEGEACDLDATPLKGCVSDLYCRFSAGGNRQGICTAPPGAGHPCATNNMGTGVFSMTICAAGTTCVQGTCQPPGGCGDNLKCDSDSYCSSTTTGLVCATRAKLGSGCAGGSNGYPCLAPAICLDNFKCGIPRVEGETCDADNPCDRYLLCVGGKCQRMNAATCPA
jgi:hypothetical protein